MSMMQMLLGAAGAIVRELGSVTIFGTNNDNRWLDVCYDSTHDRVIIGFMDANDNDTVKVVAGTIDPSDNSIAFGTVAQIGDGSNEGRMVTVCHDENTGKSIIAYSATVNSGEPQFKVLDLDPSNNTFTVGTDYLVGGSASSNKANYWMCSMYDPDAELIVVGAQGINSGAWKPRAYYLFTNTINNTGTSSDSGQAMAGGFFDQDMCYDPDNQLYLWVGTWTGTDHNWASNDESGTLFVGNQDPSNEDAIEWENPQFYSQRVSGTNNEGARSSSICYDPVNNKAVLIWRAKNDSITYGHGKACVVTVNSNGSVSFGSPVTYDTTNYRDSQHIEYDADMKKVVIFIGRNTEGDEATYITGTVSGTSISFDDEVAVDSGKYAHIQYDSGNKRLLLAYSDADASDLGKCRIL